jgi:hypothetical protein
MRQPETSNHRLIHLEKRKLAVTSHRRRRRAVEVDVGDAREVDRRRQALVEHAAIEAFAAGVEDAVEIDDHAGFQLRQVLGHHRRVQTHFLHSTPSRR